MIKMNPHKKEVDRKAVCRVKILTDLLLHAKTLRVNRRDFKLFVCVL